MKTLHAYRGTVFVALLTLIFVGLSWTSRGGGSGHGEFTLERGWPMVCWSQDYLDNTYVVRLIQTAARVLGDQRVIWKRRLRIFVEHPHV